MALDDKTEQRFNVGRLSYTLDDARRMNYQKINSLQNTILEIAKKIAMEERCRSKCDKIC